MTDALRIKSSLLAAKGPKPHPRIIGQRYLKMAVCWGEGNEIAPPNHASDLGVLSGGIANDARFAGWSRRTKAVRRRPDLKVLFTTGYTPNAVVHGGILDAGVQFLPKPFTLEQIAAKVRTVLDQKKN